MLTALSNSELFFLWDCVNDRRLNCLDLLGNDPSLDADTKHDLFTTSLEAGMLLKIIEQAMED